MRDKIDKIFFDITNIYNDYDSGKIDDKTANKHIHSLCEWYMK